MVSVQLCRHRKAERSGHWDGHLVAMPKVHDYIYN